MRKIKLFLTMAAIGLIMAACGKEPEPEIIETPNVVTQEPVRVDTNLWYSDIITSENGEKTYVYVIEVNSPDCFATPQKEDVLYGEYANSTSKNQLINKPGVKITRYCTNEEIGTKCETFFKIESSEILDLKKLSVFFKGSKIYEPGMKITTESEYKELYDDSKWFSLFSKLNIDALTSYDTLLQAEHGPNEAIFLLYDGSEVKDLYYWDTSKTELIEENNTVWKPLNLDCITAGDVNKFYDQISKQIFMPYYTDVISTEEKKQYASYDVNNNPFKVIFRQIDGDIQVGLQYPENVIEKEIPTGLYFISVAGYEYTFTFK